MAKRPVRPRRPPSEGAGAAAPPSEGAGAAAGGRDGAAAARDGAAAADALALVDALAQSAFVVMGVLTRIAAEHDVSLTQMRVLGILRDRRPRMAELADFLGLEKSTMSGLVDRAEQRGLLARGKNADDGRAVDVYMTSAGLELAEQVHAEVRAALAPLTDRLDAAERRALAGLLERMLAS